MLAKEVWCYNIGKNMKKILILIIIFLFNSCSKKWSYDGYYSPKNWGKISPKNKFCDIGYNQSPIDISAELTKDFIKNNLIINYNQSTIEKVKKEYFMHYNVYGNNFITRSNRKFNLRYIAFHHPSEHLIESNHHSLEMQFYHKSDDEQHLVISIFLEINDKNPTIDNFKFNELLNFIKSQKNEMNIKLNDFINNDDLSFYYEGSFTTPPCSEGVKWYIYKTPIYLSKNQLLEIIKNSIFIKSNIRNIQKYNP